MGFVQGDSYITQPVILAGGKYTLSLLAAQSAMNDLGQLQSLSVLVDGKPVKTIQPAGTTFTEFNDITFSVGPGNHTIRIQGLNHNDSAVLIDSVVLDAVALGLASSPTTPTPPTPPTPPEVAVLRLDPAVCGGPNFAMSEESSEVRPGRWP